MSAPGRYRLEPDSGGDAAVSPSAPGTEPTRPDPDTPSLRERWLRPGWPLAAIFVPFPLWWAMGLSEFACLIFAIPMVVELARRRTITVPRGFGWWLLFLAWVGAGVAVLSVDAVGAVADSNSTRYLTWAYRLSWYLAITVVGVYVVNTRKQLSAVRVTRIVSILFLTVVAGGLLGVVFPHFEFSSLLELILPKSVAETPFINHMIHPSAAQLQDVLGYSSPRPSAPYDYTNIWGLNYAVTLPFFLFAWCGKTAGWRRYVAPFVLVLSAVPVIYSINRGMWAALFVVGLFVAVRAALSGRPAMMGGVILGAIAVVALVSVTSLGGVVQDRLASEGSAQGRTNLGTLSVTSVSATSPIIGLGSTRNVQGNFNTITGGATADCPRCSPPALGTQGQLWLVIFCQGILGLILYLAFFGLTFVRALRLPTPITTMGLSVLVASFVTMPFYNALGTALMVVMIAVALVTREHESTGVRLPTLATYLRPVRQRIGLVAILAIVGLDLGILWQHTQGVSYVATQQMLVPASGRLPSGGYGPMNLDTEAQLLNGTSVSNAVYSATGIRLPPDQQDLRVVALPNSQIINLSFRADTSDHAIQGVAAASQAFLDERQQQLDAERKDEVGLLTKQALGLDTSLRVLDAALSTVDGGDARVPIVETRNTREQRSSLLTRIQQVNYQINRISGTPANAGSYLNVIKVSPKNDVWNVALASGLMLGLLAGACAAMFLERKGTRLRRPEIVLRETGVPVIASLPASRGLGRAIGSPSGLGRTRREQQARGTSAAALTHLSMGVSVYDADLVVALGHDPQLVAIAQYLQHSARQAQPVGATGTSFPRSTAAGVAPRVVVVISRQSRTDELGDLVQNLTRGGHDVVGVVLC